MDRLRRETRTSSHSSGSTGGEFAQTRQDLPTNVSMATEWTDEKHSLYLKSMEASFVDQLYNSMNLPGFQVQEEVSDSKLPQLVHCNTRTPSGQFKVLRGGSWKKINFQKPDSDVNMANEHHGLLINPWIQHFRSARKSQVAIQENAILQSQATNLRRKKAVASGTSASLKHSYLCSCYSCCHCLVDSNKEVSDQNFVDEDIKNEKISSTCSSKRLKIHAAGASSEDQVVPHGKSPATGTEKCISATI